MPPGTQLVDLVTVQAIENPENSQEQVQDIQVQGDRSSDLILNMEPPHDELGVDQLQHSAISVRNSISLPRPSPKSMRKEV